jgi:transcriptional regulator with XRE-family HTH domain
MAFATKLTELREAAGLTQGQLAEAAFMSKRGVSHLEQGLREPGWDTIQKLARALGVGIEAFSSPESGSILPRGRGRPRKTAAPTQPAAKKAAPKDTPSPEPKPAKKKKAKGA